jgi:hypothetical protein
LRRTHCIPRQERKGRRPRTALLPSRHFTRIRPHRGGGDPHVRKRLSPKFYRLRRNQRSLPSFPLSRTAHQWDPSLVAMSVCLMPRRSTRSRPKRLALCATLLVGQKTVSRLDLSRTVRHPAQRIPLALARPQIPAQLSASVRPGEVLPRLNVGRFGFPGRGRAPCAPRA